MNGSLILLFCLASHLVLTDGWKVACKGMDYQVFNDANFTIQEAKGSCKLASSKLVLDAEVRNLYHCEPSLLEGKIYWVQGTVDNCTAIFHGRTSFVSINNCNGRYPTICTRPSPPRPPTPTPTNVLIQDTTKTNPSASTPASTDMLIQYDAAGMVASTQHWEAIPRNNTFIHIVKEGLTQEKAILGCKQWFNGSLLQMSIDELFLDLSNVTLHGHYWIHDIEDSNFTDDCLVYSRLGTETSITTMNCDEKHFCMCQSIANTDDLLNNDFFEEILKELVMYKNETGKDFRSKNSAWDSRVTAHIVGGSGIVFMIIFGVVVAMFDLPYLKYFVSWLMRKCNSQ